MLRLVLCLCIVFCSALAGIHFSQRLVCRRDTLKSLSDLLRRALALISYNSGDLSEVFSENFAGFDFERSTAFDEQWRAFADSFSGQLTKEDIILVGNFADGIGASDGSSLKKHIELYITLLDEQISRSQADIDTKSKMYRILPLSVGLIISILMI